MQCRNSNIIFETILNLNREMPNMDTALQYIIVSANKAVQSISSRLDFKLGKPASKKKGSQ